MSDKSRRKLRDLRVTDLKHELEKRHLDNTGNKSILMQRLEQAITAEGVDPHECLFVCGDKTGLDEADESKHNTSDSLGEASNVQKSDSCGYVRSDSAQDRLRHEDRIAHEESPHQNENIEVRNTGDLLVHDDEEESDLLADSGGAGRRNHNHMDPVSTASPAPGSDLPADSTQNPPSTNGTEELTKEASDANGAAGDAAGDNSDQRRRHGTDDTEDELNRSRDYRSDRSVRDSPDEVANSKNLWVSNLSSRVKAAELKEMVMRYGPADGAKIIVSSRSPDSPFGYVTMATVEAADECVKAMNGMEWHGKIIKVKKIARDPTVPGVSSSQNGSESDSKNRHPTSRASGTRRSGEGLSRRVAASDRRRLAAKGATTMPTDDVENRTGDDQQTAEGRDSAEGTKPDGEEGKEKSEGAAAPVRDIEYYKRKARRDADYIRELEATVERNRRRQNFQIQREREKSSRTEQQYRKEISSLRRERDLLSSERDLLDKRRSDLDRLEKSLLDRERMLKDRERHLEEKERDVVSLMQRARQPTTLSATSYPVSAQSSSRYYQNSSAAVPSASSSSKRPYQSVDVDSHGSSWGPSKRALRNEYSGSDRRESQVGQQSSSYPYRSGGTASSGARARDYDERGGYGSGVAESGSYSRGRTGAATSGGAGGRWGGGDRSVQSSAAIPSSGQSLPSSVGHWVKPTNHRPPFVSGSGSDVDASVGETWSRGSASMGMQGGTRRF